MNEACVVGVLAAAALGWFLGDERGYLRRQREAADEYHSREQQLGTIARSGELWVVPQTELERELQAAIRTLYSIIGHSSQIDQADAIRVGDLIEADERTNA